MLQSFVDYSRPIVEYRPQMQEETITPVELYQRLSRGESLLVVDVRSPEEYRRDGHVAGSLLLPLQMLPQVSHRLPTEQTIVLVCRSGKRSSQACHQLRCRGFTRLINLTTGMVGWHQAGLPSASLEA